MRDRVFMGFSNFFVSRMSFLKEGRRRTKKARDTVL